MEGTLVDSNKNFQTLQDSAVFDSHYCCNSLFLNLVLYSRCHFYRITSNLAGQKVQSVALPSLLEIVSIFVLYALKKKN